MVTIVNPLLVGQSEGQGGLEFLYTDPYYFHSYSSFHMWGLNARFGSLPDIKNSELQVSPREHIDKSVNSHGKPPLDFLLTSDMCVLNGRSGLEGNQYTSISIRGMAVVDYCLVPHEDLANYQDITVTSIPEVMEKQGLQVDTTLSDYSVLSWRLKIPFSISKPVIKDSIQKVVNHILVTSVAFLLCT